MEPLTFLIAILGCGEADASCQQVRMLEARYESREACVAATEAAVGNNTDVDYPVIVAQCVAAGGPRPHVKADDVQRPGSGRADLRVSPVRS
jgi:hypothetical protein